ncbi:protein CUSTOS [Candoia aspera]|uniref:protein CUSTOS n=1 Tax=Candoia aspera TaxID=51853 RepID=UPI002FD7D881
MAAPNRDASDSDSEEEAAAWERLREAAWDPALGRAAALAPGDNSWTRNQQAAESSIRERICNRGQDGNELQTTPEFQAHVAKKLDTILDNLITTSTCPSLPAWRANGGSLEEDDGFRLFSSSVPGDRREPETTPRKRLVLRLSSSSDLESDPEWQRCQEAAVTAADILKQSGLPPPAVQDSGQGQSCQTTKARWKEVKRKKKKGRREVGQQGAIEAAGQSQTVLGPEGPSCPGRAHKSTEAASRTGSVQRRKKKKWRKTEAGTE